LYTHAYTKNGRWHVTGANSRAWIRIDWLVPLVGRSLV